ncbi:MAG: glycosyltransferase [Oenococcus sp.]|uniref:glycosyltransferase n=1 Tax=Oenococcus sp. TaxID=1979414 RepID=UPI0039ED166F
MVAISAILPIYNVDKYLRKSVQSLLEQTLSDIEIILVDDGSTDKSPLIVDEFAQIDNRVKAVHQVNAGAAAARNLGISVAEGKYLYFMDPDDYMEPAMLSELYMSAEAHNATLVIAGFQNIYETGRGTITTKVSPDPFFFENALTFRNSFYKYLNNTLIAVPWNKLYLRKHIIKNHLEFPKVKWDDLHFNIEAIRDIERVAVISNTSYHFLRERVGSETTKVFDDRLFDYRKQQFEHILKIYQSWNLTSKQSNEMVYYYFVSRVVECLQQVAENSRLTIPNKIKKMKNILQDPITREAVCKYKSDSKMMAIATLPIKLNSPYLSLLMGNSISFVKNNFANFFLSMRARVMSTK